MPQSNDYEDHMIPTNLPSGLHMLVSLLNVCFNHWLLKGTRIWSGVYRASWFIQSKKEYDPRISFADTFSLIFFHFNVFCAETV